MITIEVVIGWIVALICIGLFIYTIYITDLYSNYKKHKKTYKDSNLDYGYTSYENFLRIITTKKSTLNTLKVERFAWWENIGSTDEEETVYLDETHIKINNKLMIMETFLNYKKYRKYYNKLLKQLREKEESNNKKKIKERNNVDWSSFSDE